LLYTPTAVVIGETCPILPIIMNMSGRIRAWTGIGRDFFAAGFAVESVSAIAEKALDQTIAFGNPGKDLIH
jgi:hypothetical protein